MKKLIFIFLASAVIFAACGKKENDIEKKKLARIYVDLMVVKEKYSDTDSLKIYRENILAKYNVTDEQYKSSFDNIESKEENWKSFFAEANAYLDSLKASAE